MALILLIVIAYSCAVLAGQNSRNLGLQKYVGCLKELKRYTRRHSTFWIGLSDQLWVGAIEFWVDLAHDFMRLQPRKLPYFQKDIRAMTLIQPAL